MSKNNQSIIKLQVNKEALIGNLKYTFSSPANVFKELLQNSRRAGANLIEVEISSEKDFIRIKDNGCGINDFGNLLNVSESGWSSEVKAIEHAFGMGWVSCLYNAESVEVISNGKRAAFNTSEALSFSDLVVEEVAGAKKGETIITLHGVKKIITSISSYGEGWLKGEEALLSGVRKLTEGFSIPLVVNGLQTVGCYRAGCDGLEWIESTVGLIGMTESVKDSILAGGGFEIAAYLQGFLIARKKIGGFYHSKDLIVHLDGNQFFGRMPDREQLHENVEAEKTIVLAVMSMLKARIMAEKDTMSEAAWLCKYYESLKLFGMDDEIEKSDYIPVSRFYKWGKYLYDYPMGTSSIHDATNVCGVGDMPAHLIVDGCVSRKLVEEHKALFCVMPSSFSESSQWSLCKAVCLEHNMLMLDRVVFDKEMWINEYCIDFEEYAISEHEANTHMLKLMTVRPCEGVKSAVFCGETVNSVEINLQKSVTVQLGDEHTFELGKEAFAIYSEYETHSAYVFCRDDTYLIHSLTCFTSDDRYIESWFERDEYLFKMFLMTLCGDSTEHMLKAFLTDALMAFPGRSDLVGKSVGITFDNITGAVSELAFS